MSFNVNVSHHGVEVQFELKSKFTIIRGDSAVGKTSSIRSVLDLPTAMVSHEEYLTIRPTDRVEVVDSILDSADSNNILVLDGDSIRTLRKFKRMQRLNYVHSYVLIFYRAPLPELSYLSDNVYAFVYDNMSVSLHRVTVALP